MSKCEHKELTEDGCCFKCGVDVNQERIAKLEKDKLELTQISTGLYAAVEELEAEIKELNEYVSACAEDVNRVNAENARLREEMLKAEARNTKLTNALTNIAQNAHIIGWSVAATWAKKALEADDE